MKPIFLLAILVILFSTGVSRARAQTGGGYDLTWNTLSDGGGNSAGSGYALIGTIGQPTTGPMSDGNYTLMSGFWVSGVVEYRVYLPRVARN